MDFTILSHVWNDYKLISIYRTNVYVYYQIGGIDTYVLILIARLCPTTENSRSEFTDLDKNL